MGDGLRDARTPTSKGGAEYEVWQKVGPGARKAADDGAGKHPRSQRPARGHPRGRLRAQRRSRRRLHAPQGRNPRARGRVRLRKIRHEQGGAGHQPRQLLHGRADPLPQKVRRHRRLGDARPRRRRVPRHPRRGNRHDLSGADDVVLPAVHHRQPACRNHPATRARRDEGAGAGARARNAGQGRHREPGAAHRPVSARVLPAECCSAR